MSGDRVKWPGDASRELAAMAVDELRATFPDELWAEFAIDVLAAVVDGLDFSTVMDARSRVGPRDKAVRAVNRSRAEGKGMNAAFAAAAEELGIEDRTVRRHWRARWPEGGPQPVRPSTAPFVMDNATTELAQRLAAVARQLQSAAASRNEALSDVDAVRLAASTLGDDANTEVDAITPK